MLFLNMGRILDFFKKYGKFIIISGLILAALSFFDKKLPASLILIAFLASVAMFFINKIRDEKQRKIISILFLFSFLLHIIVVFILFYASFQPFSGGRGDFIQYHSTAVETRDRLSEGNFSIIGLALAHYFPLIVGYLYYLLIPKMIIGQLLNAWLVALIIVFAYLIVKELGRSDKEAFIVALVINLYPSLAFFGSLLLKEAFVVFFSALSILLSLKLIKRFSWKIFALFYISLMGLAHFRFFVILPVIFIFVLFWLLFSDFLFKKRVVYGLIMILLFGFLPIISTVGGKDIGYFGINEIKRQINFKNIIYYRDRAYNFVPEEPVNSVESVEPAKSVGSVEPAKSESEKTVKEAATKENSQSIAEEIVKVPEGAKLSEEYITSTRDWGQDSSVNLKTGNSKFEFLKNSFLSFINAFFGPFPWQFRNLKHLFVAPEIILWWIFLFFIFRGIIKYLKYNYLMLIPFLFGLILIGIISVYMTNFGLVTRLRMPAFISLMCLIPFGLGKVKDIKIPFLKFLE